ncbi:hypothetical protein FB554_0158 [Barrientosiimonas humi]|uniref:Uncharacterized protein n=1 Tax=Barrientosiimonas humi TaxID=999931 RepID=A0A542X875_9MICO|nr:hypothetical protein FB554_0158 [Barrientosiimonas humi]CAG7571976.1 hypothetical protein BH39T_PBIAJDOK_00642 [Barrientosiimonas humi]
MRQRVDTVADVDSGSTLTRLVAELLTAAFTLIGVVVLPWASIRLARRRRGGVALPAFVQHPGRVGHGGARSEQMARLVLDGPTGRVVGSRLHAVLPLESLRQAPVARSYVREGVGEVDAVVLRDESGQRWTVGVLRAWRQALAVEGRRPLAWPRRWWLAGPRWIGVVLALIVPIPVVTHLLYWLGSDRTVSIVRTWEHPAKGERCEVRWADGATSELGCRDWFASAGEQVTIHTMPWPLSRWTISDETLVAVTVLTLLPMLLLATVQLVTGAVRIARRPTRLLPEEPDPGAGATAYVPAGASFVQLWQAVAARESWYAEEQVVLPERRQRWRAALHRPVLWWFAAIVLGMGLLGLPRGWVFVVPGLLVVGYGLLGAARTLARLSAAAREPGRPWPFLALRTDLNTWQALLVQDGRPAWLLDLGRAHPHAAGTALVHGPVREGSWVLLDADGARFVPQQPAAPVGPEQEQELRAALRARLGRRTSV